MSKLIEHARRHCVGYVALFVSLSAGAYATVRLPANSVGTTQIRAQAVTPPKLASSVLTRSYTRGESDARFLGARATANDSAKLGGTPASAFATTSQNDARYLGIGAPADDSAKLGGTPASAFATTSQNDGKYLGIGSRAADSAKLGGVAASTFVRNDCNGPGAIKGFARIRASSISFPTTFTSDPTWIDTTYNCAGGSVSVARAASGSAGAGQYWVVFNSNPAALAVATVFVPSATLGTGYDGYATVRAFGSGSFYVDVRDTTGTLSDREFDILLP